jgi:septum formation protein
MLGVKDLKIIPAVGEEKAAPGLPPDELVKTLAAHKAREVAPQAGPEEIVIAADTIVWHEGRVFGKPRSGAEAAEMLRALSGEEHAVYTGVSVIRNGVELLACERSLVRFRELTEHEIAAYIATGEPMDKAGAYAIQGGAGAWDTKLDGSFENVMGFPVDDVKEMLGHFGL